MRRILLTMILMFCLAPRAAADPDSGLRELDAADPDSGPGEPVPLADRALAWVAERSDGRWRMRERGSARWVRYELVPLAEQAVEEVEWPDAEALLAKAWWESRWRPVVFGKGDEHGLVQLMPRYAKRYLRAGETRASLLRPAVNLRVAAARLQDDWEACGRDEAQALARYASSQCVVYARDQRGRRVVLRPGTPERVVLAWAEQMRVIDPR